MKSYDNNGKLVGEINQFRTGDGKSIVTNTQLTRSMPSPKPTGFFLEDYRSMPL